MAKTLNASTVLSTFTLTGAGLVDALEPIFGLKKLGWSPDVKIKMASVPTATLANNGWRVLRTLTVAEMQDMLAAFLQPLKHHDLFDLADWLRDLDTVPDYLKTYWSEVRMPQSFENVARKALNIDNDDGEPDEKVDTKPVGLRTPASRRKSPPTMKAVPVKTAKPQVKKPSSIEERVSDKANQILVDEGLSALSGDLMKTNPKAAWTRVNKAVRGLLQAEGMDFGTPPRRTETESPTQSMIQYTLGDWTMRDPAEAFADFRANFLTAFDGHVADLEPVDDEEPPRSFKVWFEHV